MEWRKLPMYSTCFSLHQNWSQYRPQHGQLRLLFKWMFEIGGRGSVHGQNRETRCIWAWNVRSLFYLNFYIAFSLPELCTEGLAWGTSSPSCHCVWWLAKAHHIIGTIQCHSSHLLIHLWNIHTRLWLGAGIQTIHILCWSAHVHAHTQYR